MAVGVEKDFTHMTSARSTPAQRVLLEAALRADPVLGPLLDFGRCVVTYGGEPGTHCCHGQPHGRCADANGTAATAAAQWGRGSSAGQRAQTQGAFGHRRLVHAAEVGMQTDTA